VNLIHALEQVAANLPGVSTAPHNMGGREFVWQEKEIGHIHWNGDLDILFSKKIRDVLIAHQLVEVHKWVPDSGWTTFKVKNEKDLEHAFDLLQLSYCQKRKRVAKAEEEVLEINARLEKLPFPEVVLDTIK
jgi:Family of unknown function (DUF5519)